jgi:peptide/nickel transport system permease protein
MRRCFRHLNFKVGFAMSSFLFAFALTSLVWTPFDSNRMNAQERLQRPSWRHTLGTDQYGRDILSRLMKGASNAMVVGLIAVAIGFTTGVIIGLVSAYYGNLIDEALMRLCDLLFAFPAILTAILITAVYSPTIVNAMLAIGIFYIPIFARLTRASALSVLPQEFVTAARASGAGEAAIIWRHVFPNIFPPLLIQGTIQFAVAILAEAGLSYMGLGTQPPDASWGRMLNEAQTFISISPWMAIFPGAAIAWAVLAFNLLGDGLRDALDPKLVGSR